VQDLNDFYYFVEVVTHGGFAPAGRALGVPKSKLSRRLAQLEDRLGVRLIERSTRRFRITDVGQACFERSRAMMIEAEGAAAVAAQTRGEPQGFVRFSCPLAMMEPLAAVLNAYLAQHRHVRLEIVAATRAMDLIDERIDVALRVRTTLDRDMSLTMRSLAVSRRILVASRALASTIMVGTDISELGSVPTLGTDCVAGEAVWTLLGPDGTERTVRHKPRMICGDMSMLRTASIAGLGVALLPDHLCRHDLSDGRLVQVFPEWRVQDGILHLVFTTRRGLPPAVRALIDHLAIHFRDDHLLRDALMP
jgi:DNA-binding transcriptional LysR family regulator